MLRRLLSFDSCEFIERANKQTTPVTGAMIGAQVSTEGGLMRMRVVREEVTQRNNQGRPTQVAVLPVRWGLP